MKKVRKDLNMWEYIAYGVILVLVIPYFLGIAFAESPQLRDSFLILIFCTLVIGVKYSIKPRKPVFSYLSIGILAFAYLSLFLYKLSVFFMLGALVLTLTAVALLFLERKDFKLAYAFGVGFYSYSLAFVFTPFFDFPLRFIAGLGASKVLDMIGVANKLLLLKKDDYPIFLRCPDKGDFIVATQCNGFSIIASSLILSLFIAVFSSVSVFKKVGYVLFALLFAYATNVLRICVIVMLNPIVGEENYFVMHEVVGYASTISTLIILYLIPTLARKNAWI